MTWLRIPLRNETIHIDLEKVKVISVWEKKVEFYFNDKHKQTFGLGGSGAVNKIEMDDFFKIKEVLKANGIER
jgi:hypothetical protein